MKLLSRRTQGYAYVEVIIAALVVMVAVVPAAEALRSVAAGSVLQRELVAQKYAAMAGDGAGGGWKFDVTSGKLIVNDTSNDSTGTPYDSY